MDVRYINPFLIAVQDVFDTMIDLPFKLGKPAIKNDNIASHEISGIIGLSGDVDGCVVISISKEVAYQLASTLLDEEITEINADCTDAIGEVANMIAGNAKSEFPNEENVTISVPSVIIGQHRVAYPSGIRIISIPCKASDGEIVIDVALKMNV